MAEDITFNIIDQSTVDRLRNEGDIELPYKKLDINKDMRWNTKWMSSKLLQGILDGSSVDDIADSILPEIDGKSDIFGKTFDELKGIAKRNEQSAIRNARTMVTGAENAGRLDSYKNLESQGVVQNKVWIATPDARTRKTHAEIDGEEIDINDQFSNGLEYPGDPHGDASEVYNCRCSMRTHIIGFKRSDGSVSRVNYDRDRTMHDEQMERRRR
jgi:uncharacterized protein with gpF-like domain